MAKASGSNRTRFWQRIQGKIFFVLLVLLVPTLLIQSYVFYEWYKTQRRNELQANLEIARAVAEMFRSFVQDVLRQELSIGITFTLPQPLSSDQMNGVLVEINGASPAVRNFTWATPEGRCIASSLPGAIGLDISMRPYYHQILAGEQSVVSNLFPSSVNGEPIFSISRGIRDSSGNLLGIAIAAVASEDLEKVLKIERFKGGAYSLIDRNGMLVYRNPSINPTWEQRNWLKDYSNIKEVLNGKEVSEAVYAPFEGKTRLVGVTPVPSIGWAVSAGRTEEIAMNSVISQLSYQAIMFFLIISGGFTVALLVSRFISNPVKRLRDHAVTLGRGEPDAFEIFSGPAELKDLADSFNQMAAMLRTREASLREQREWLHVTLTSIGDAVMTTDTAGQVTFLNPVAAALTGWSVGQASGQPAQNILRTINEQTKEPTEDIVAKVLRDGCTVALANHTALVARDGKEIPIEDSAAPIRDGAGNVSGVVLVFHDVTDKRRAQQALKQSEEHYRSLFDNMLNGYAYCRMLFENDQPEDFIYLSVNCAFENLTGLKNVIGKKVSEVIPGIRKSDPGLLEIYGRVARTGVPERFETYVEALEMWFSISVYRPREEHFVAVFDVITERKLAEEALRESRELLRAVTEGSPDPIFVKDRQGRFIMANSALFQFWGKPMEEVIGKNDCELFEDPAFGETIMANDRMVMQSGVSHVIEEVVLGLEGGLRTYLSTKTPFRDGNGEIVGILGVVRDITERKQAEEALQESKAKLEAALASMTDAVFISDAKGLFIDTNEAFATFLKFKNKDECFKTFAEYPDVFELSIAGQQVSPEMWPVRRALGGETAINAEYTLRRKDTDETWIGSHNLSPIRDKNGVIVGSVVTARDITEQKRIEEELRENQSKLDLALRSAEMGVWHWDVAENKRVFDDQVCRLLGIDASRFTGAAEEFFDAVHPDDREKLRTALARTVEHGAPYETEYRAVWPNGSIHHIAARGRLLCDDKGRLFRVNGLIWDVTERKRAEERLRTTVQRFNNILSNVLYGILLVGEDDRVEFANQYFCDQFGFAECPSDLIGMTAKEMIQKVLSGYADPEVNVARVHQIVTQGNRVRGEEVTMRDGQVLLRDFVPITVDGKPSGRMWHHRDITERKRMEEELRKSKNELELRVKERTAELLKASEELREKAEIIDFAHDAILARDIDGRIVFWSKGAEETYGFRKEETLGQIGHDFLKAALPLPLETVLEVVLQKGEWRGEIKHTKANGERIVVDSRWAVQFGLDGKPAGFLEVNRDVTARKIAEEEFRKADRAFRTLSEFNQAMVRQTDEMELLRQVCRIVADVGGYRLVWVGFAENDENKSVVPIASAGYDYGYLAQAKITWADNERGQGPCGISIRTGKMSVSQNAESNPAFAPWRFDAAKRGIASSISLPLIVEGHVIGALGIYASEPDAFDEGESGLLSNLAENLSYGIASIRLAEQRRRSEEELRVYASRLELINQELQEFAFVASHDLQEPLRKIQTFCDMAQKRCAPVLDSTSKDYLDRVVNSADLMRQLLRDLLEFSRVASRLEPFKKIDLVKIAMEAADIFEASVKETGCQIEVENIPAIEADESQMLRLFQNLIGNAMKFRRETPNIRVYGKLDGKRICEIFVEDNGIGFDQQFAELIFKPFQRLHGRNEYDGTGMGLAICRKIVERHGGSIRAESEPGKGSTFIIRLPVKQDRLETIIARQQS
jgi:PAS domain S-box-containing protein